MTQIPVNTVPVDDVSLAYRESGSGYPVVFINGLGSTMDMWNPPVLSKISDSFRVIIFDNRGTGFSSSSDKPFSIPLLARDTAALMDALDISSAHVLGLSMGASVAQELTLSFPWKVNKLILVAGECGGPESVRMQPEIMAQLMDKSGTVLDVVNRMFPSSSRHRGWTPMIPSAIALRCTRPRAKRLWHVRHPRSSDGPDHFFC